MTLHKLRAMAMRERATIYHTMRLSRDDSEMLARRCYTMRGFVISTLRFCDVMTFNDFAEELKEGSIPYDGAGFKFHGMKIEWFCDGPTRFVLESFIYN